MRKNFKKLILLSCAVGTIFTTLPTATYANTTVTNYIVNADNYQLPYNGTEQDFANGINPGYGSGLSLKSINPDGSIEFYCLTDRGPNGDIPTYIQNGQKYAGKFFPTPNFTPSIGILKISNNHAEIINSIPLKDKNNQKISGKVIPFGNVGSTGELALDFTMKNFGTDNNGLDTEGIARDKDGNFWLCDEYGPFLIKTDSTGKILEKYGPGMGLPDILAQRVPNRGFEGVTIDDQGNIIGIVQSPLDVDGKTSKTAPYTRIVKLNSQTKEVTMYAYPIDTGYKNFSKTKLGDITSIGNNQYLVIEQGKQNGKMQNLIYKVDLNNATAINGTSDLEYNKLPNDFKPAQKELIIDLRKNGWNIEKAEGLALLPDRQTIAVVNDNDFGIAIKVNNSTNPKASVEDYTYNADTKEFSNKDNKVVNITIGLQKNAPEEQQSQIYLFKLDHKI